MKQHSHSKSNWQQLKVNDIKLSDKGSIVSGPFGSNIGKKFFVDEGVPLIRGNNLTFGTKKFIDDGFVYITKEKAYELRNCEALPGDLIFTAAGTLGQVGLIQKSSKYSKYIISNKQLRLRCNPKIALPIYLFYWFSSPKMREQIINLNTGSSVPLITLGTLRSLPVLLPPLSTQHKIAFILSAYDDLIENNTRRIAILEEMAQTIYQEWFVHFRYPGHEKIKMVESELGLIPEKWKTIKVSQAVDIDPLTRVSKEEEKPFISMENLSNNSMIIKHIEYRRGNSGSKFKNGDTLFARITPCIENGKIGYVQFLSSKDEVACGSTEFIVLRSKTLCPTYIYLMARSEEFRNHAIKSMSGASGRQRVQKACFDSFWIVNPDPLTLTNFEEIVTPLFRCVQILVEKNINLRRTRDLLLPKLISGEIDVETLDIDISDMPEPEAEQQNTSPIVQPEPIDASQLAFLF